MPTSKRAPNLPRRRSSAAVASPILRVERVTVQRSGVSLLRDVSWSIQPGERWVIVGPNGSGKTSLLSVLAGFLHATSGHISVLGEIHGESNFQELRRHIGIVSSSIRQMVNDDETALEVIASGLFGQINYWGLLKPKHLAAARRMAEQVRCLGLETRPWAVLSQGERQRILIGRALLAKPKLLILDEPCAGLDPAAREHFLEFIDRLAQQNRGPAVVLVTHHVEEIMPAFTHVLALRGGRVVAAAEKGSVLRSDVLSRVFGAKMHLSQHDGRWWLRVSPAGRSTM